MSFSVVKIYTSGVSWEPLVIWMFYQCKTKKLIICCSYKEGWFYM